MNRLILAAYAILDRIPVSRFEAELLHERCGYLLWKLRMGSRRRAFAETRAAIREYRRVLCEKWFRGNVGPNPDQDQEVVQWLDANTAGWGVWASPRQGWCGQAHGSRHVKVDDLPSPAAVRLALARELEWGE